MKYSKLMKERIHRSRVLFAELGYTVLEGERDEESYSAGFERDDFQGGFFIDGDSKFLEIAFTFSFSTQMGEFIRDKLQEMLRVCYEYGCYMNLQKDDNEISFSVFTKVYFAGLNYYALRETLRDFRGCIDSLKEVVDIREEEKG
jgi:hypothetical protein